MNDERVEKKRKKESGKREKEREKGERGVVCLGDYFGKAADLVIRRPHMRQLETDLLAFFPCHCDLRVKLFYFCRSVRRDK